MYWDTALAGRTHGDAQRLSELTDPQAAIARMTDEVQHLEKRSGRIVSPHSDHVRCEV
jgi:hypothetical protein